MEHDFHVVTMRQLGAVASGAGLVEVERENFTYPPEVVPQSVQWAARALRPLTRRLPWAWRFVYRPRAGRLYAV